MPMLNARCDRCGTIFPSGIFVGDGARSITFAGNKSGPCPTCGSMGSLIANDTTIDVIGNEVVIRRGVLTPIDLATIAGSLRPFQGGGRSKKAVEEALIKAVPELESEVRGLSEAMLIAIIGFILQLAAMMQNQVNAQSDALQIDQLIQEVRALKSRSSSAEHHLKTAPNQEDNPPSESEPGGDN